MNREVSVFRVYFSAMLIFFLLRLAFLFYHRALFQDAQLAEILRALGAGLLVDSSVAATTVFLIRLITLPLQWVGLVFARRIFWGCVFLLFGLFFFINLADIVHFEMFDSRVNILLLENLDQIGPIVQTIIAESSTAAVAAVWIAVLLVFMLLLRVKSGASFGEFRRRYEKTSATLALVALVPLTFLWIGEPFWRLSELSAGNQALNQLSLNGVYTVAKAIDQKHIWERDFGDINYLFGPPEAALAAVQSRLLAADEIPLAGNFPMARKLAHPVPLAVDKPNVVIILMEGFSASFCGALCSDSIGYSPAFDSLAKQGILFTNFYGHETRTHHGLVSTVGSFPSLLGTFITRRRGTESFYTLGTLLRKYGYSTSFIYGYDAGFDHMGYFLRQGGFDRIIDQREFPSPRFRAQWGVSDEDLFEKVDHYFSSLDSDTPFFSVLLTSSNHTPHEVPAWFLQQFPLYRASSSRAAFAYADFALGRFFENARSKPYFRNTIFVIVADHGEIRDPKDRSFKRFHIPCLIFAPELISRPRVIPTVGAQVDIATTLLHLIGYPLPFHCLGRDLLSLPEDQGFAVLRNNTTVCFVRENCVLVRDLRDSTLVLHILDTEKRMRQDFIVDDPVLAQSMNRELEDYLQSLYLLFTSGRHRIGSGPSLHQE